MPARTATDIGTDARRHAGDERVQGRRARPAAMLDPVPDVVLVDVDGLAVHQTMMARAMWDPHKSRLYAWAARIGADL